MKVINFAGLVGGLLVSLVFSLLVTIPSAIPFYIWFFSIFGAGVAGQMIIELIISCYQHIK